MKPTTLLIGCALALLAGLALADEAPKPLRLIGEAASAKDPAPHRFVIDARLKPGDGEFQSTIEGWFAGLDAPASGSIEGSCVEKRCALSVSLDSGKYALTGDLAGAAGPVAARFSLKDDDDKVLSQGPATLRPLAGPVAGLGALAEPDAIDAAEMDDLLLWAHQTVGFGGGTPGDPVGDFQRQALAEWQGSKGRPATGLIFASDLAELRAEAAQARKAAGWTAIGEPGHGWSAAYPAALLPKTTRSGAERRFASPDGKAALVMAIDAPMTDEAFDDFVHRTTEDKDGRNGVNYTRVNSDLEMRYAEGGVVTVAAYHNRPGGLARLMFTYPEAAGDTWSPWEPILQRALVVTDDLKR
ncbi:MAG TPA: hypothetical protein VG939_15290 [Caulobacteraceae bacterium]|nr:hypothetical protein [Caulobacteraceae bacterium]